MSRVPEGILLYCAHMIDRAVKSGFDAYLRADSVQTAQKQPVHIVDCTVNQ